MSKTLSPLVAQAKKLPDQDKLALINVLLEDLDKPDAQIEQAWATEAVRRRQLIREGTMKTYSHAQVFAKYKP
jgi:hypothetical protein